MISKFGDRRRPGAARPHPPATEIPPLGWRDRLLHHGVRLVLLLAVAFVVYLLFPSARVSDSAVLEPGVVAPKDVVAEFAFQVPKSPEELAREQAEAASGVPPIYDYVPTAADSILAGVRSLFAAVDSAAEGAPPDSSRAVAALLQQNRIAPTPEVLELLMRSGERTRLRSSIDSLVRQMVPLGVVPTATPRDRTAAVRLRGTPGGERLVPADSLLAPEQFFQRAVAALPGVVRPDEAELLRLILIRFFQPSLRYNEADTEAARARARAAVDPIDATVLRGEKIVGAHEKVGDREAKRLQAYQTAARERGGFGENSGSRRGALGAVLFNALLLAVAGVALLLSQREVYDDLRSVLLIAALVVVVTGMAATIARMNWPPELIPVTFAALIAAVLWGVRSGLTLALVLALLIGSQTPFLGVTVLFTAAVGGSAAAFSLRATQRRAQAWILVAVIAAAYAAAAVILGLLRVREGAQIAEAAAWGAANAVLSSFVAIGFLPVVETFVRVTTPQTLLELADTNRSLLQRLQREANGTYHHTINVASLVEAACRAIGADVLLAKTGAYYHDVGKLSKPQYFIENQPRGRNPHDKLKPTMSAAIVRSHVPEGLRLAEEARLPATVRAFIAEHHGTQKIAYFLDLARQQAADPDSVKESDFIYAGPKPQSRETAVLMLADSVESAAHVLTDPTPERLQEMVNRIVDGKVASGQLDQSPITLHDLEIIREQLATRLQGMFHHRIDYPPAPTEEPTEDTARPSTLSRTGEG